MSGKCEIALRCIVGSYEGVNFKQYPGGLDLSRGDCSWVRDVLAKWVMFWYGNYSSASKDTPPLTFSPKLTLI
jgi:hypothetical protein